jgi:MFS family permease
MTIDDAPLNNFHLRVVAYTTGGYFVDGYILGMIGIALALLAPQLGLGAVWTGLIGASALAGIFIGGLIFGWVTDRVGRQTMYVADLILFVVASVLQFFVEGPLALFILRLVMGIAIGADYAIGSALLSEFLPRIAAAISRIGAAIGTFLLPTSVEQFGTGPTILGATAVLLLGLILSVAWAPETRHVSLSEASMAGRQA